MKNSINQFIKILIVLLVTSFTISCTTQQKDENQEHGDMMNDDQTEMMEGDDHMHEDGQSEEHMMNDSTSMEMNEEMQR